jgi:hypothetical protein
MPVHVPQHGCQGQVKQWTTKAVHANIECLKVRDGRKAGRQGPRELILVDFQYPTPPGPIFSTPGPNRNMEA